MLVRKCFLFLLRLPKIVSFSSNVFFKKSEFQLRNSYYSVYQQFYPYLALQEDIDLKLNVKCDFKSIIKHSFLGGGAGGINSKK